MLRQSRRFGAATLMAVTMAGAVPGQSIASDPEGDVRLLGETVVPKGIEFDGAPVGELSGIDYSRGSWVAISDDTDAGPARFYTLRVDVDAEGLHGVRFTGQQEILRADGSRFPSFDADDPEVADLESIRFDPHDGGLWWSSEGKRVEGDTVVDPWVRKMSPGGRFRGQLRQPANFAMSTEERGPRHNLGFEALTLSADGRSVVTAMEAPLYQDGPVPSVEKGADTRLTWYDKDSGRPVRQLAYPVDAIPADADPPGGFADNGVTEILAASQHRYLVLERSYAEGVGNSIRVYEIDIRGATDVLDRDSLSGRGYRPVTKRLLVDFADLGLQHVVNVEGMAWGPRLATGEHSLMFVSDDGLSDDQITQVTALAVK